MKKITIAIALSAAFLLAACSDDDDENTPPQQPPPPPTSSVPDSASGSVDGFVSYLKALVTFSDDTLEPVDTANVSGPTDETSEPVAVD